MFLVHLFLPHKSNNHRPKILHNSSLLVIALLFLATFLAPIPRVLGIATNITIDRLTELTNKERANNNLSSLVLNNELSLAAQEKAKDMFNNNYWAHNSPIGKTPWVFIINSGYEYSYAGENLARDFDSAENAVSAWMASPGHRANILSANYQDIGFVVATGKLSGHDTTLIVQMFGTKKAASISLLPNNNLTLPSSKQVLSETPLTVNLLRNNFALSALLLLMGVLAVDAIIARRRALVRHVGHNVDHIIFLGSFVLALLSTRGGVIF